MNDIRNLERKFALEIKKHLFLAIPELSKMLSEVDESSNFEDTQLSFDLIFNLTFTVSVRIRKFKYLKFNDLTIRSKTKAGGKTEIDKIMEGKAQIYFYAYMNKEETEIVKVRIIDIESIRSMTNDSMYKLNKNLDKSEFFSFLFCDIKKYNGDVYKFDKK